MIIIVAGRYSQEAKHKTFHNAIKSIIQAEMEVLRLAIFEFLIYIIR